MNYRPKSIYSALQKVWRLLPEKTRSAESMVNLREKFGSLFPQHKQGIYSENYYLENVEEAAFKASSKIAQSVCKHYRPNRVVDVGCGTGALLEGFRRFNTEVLGLEYSIAGCDLTRKRGIPVKQFDIRNDTLNPDWGSFDVVLCTEVAEHIDHKYADRLIKILVSLGNTIIFTAAPPGQGGADHVNEQPREYWIEKFKLQGFEFKNELTSHWSRDWRLEGISFWYWQNLFLFQKAS